MIDRHRRVPLVHRHPRGGAAVAGATLCSLIHPALGMPSRAYHDFVLRSALIFAWFCHVVVVCCVVWGAVLLKRRGAR